MKELFGKTVLEHLHEIVDPKHTAIIVVDMQNDMGGPGGHKERVIGSIRALIEGGRRAGVRVVYILYSMLPNHSTATPTWIYGYRRTHGGSTDGIEMCYEGTWGEAVVDELAPFPEEIIVRKNHRGAFFGTNLDRILRGLDIKSVVITGVGTSHCVLDTAIGAHAFDYYTVIARDCVADGSPKMHEAGLAIFEDRYDCPTMEELVTLWASVAESSVAAATER